MRYLFSIVIFLAVFYSCTKDKGKLPVVVPVSIDSCVQDVTYAQDIAPIIASTCAIPTCHVPSGYKDMTSYAALKGIIDGFGANPTIARITAGSSAPMPPTYTSGPPSVTTCEFQKLKTWIDAGYPNN